MIAPGASAPDFSLPNHEGERVSLSDYSGLDLVLAFYPADFSPICNDQLSVYQEVLEEIEAEGGKLVGISVDGVFSHAAFRAQAGLTFPLLSDFHPKGEVAQSYGAYIPERGHCNRSLVVVDGGGTVSYAYEAAYPEVPGANLIFDALADLA